jgi:hypothetical protein
MAAGLKINAELTVPVYQSQEIQVAKQKEFAEADEEAKDGRVEGCTEESRGSDAKEDQKERREEIARTLSRRPTCDANSN